MNCHYHPEVASSAFCQFCGKPLCKDCIRNVGGAVYCEACLAERLRAAGTMGAAFSTGTPHPLLAGLLGFIPGVGAMYNGQYAKAIAHVLIFAVLASLGDHSSIFGILVAAWVFYQVFDAYQTAMARRDGQPLPNPFGLNDIAQRLGIHPHTWVGGAPGAVPPVPPIPPAPPYGSNWEPMPGPSTSAGPGSVPGSVPPAATPGMSGFVPSGGAAYPNQPGYTGQSGYAGQPGYTGQAGYSSQTGYTSQTGYANVPGPMPGQPYPPVAPFDPYTGRRDLPVGAIILIGLGILFLFGSLGLLRGIWIAHLWPLLIIGLGIWIIIRRTRTVTPTAVPPVDPSAVPPGVHSDPTGGVR